MYRRFSKRLIDLVVSSIGLTILAPLFVLISILLAAANNGSPFFVQTRPGRDGRPFKLIKFKTMNNQRDKRGSLLPDAERLTNIGRFIRKTSLDEIPQLINVLLGQMSLIGPRPLLMEYMELYNAEQRRRQNVRPGITGWAQINGRNTLSWKQKFEYDLYYIDHLSLWLDLKIFLITILKVFKAEGISGNGVATAEKFNGEN